MEWKPVHIPKSELERKQSDYTREALEMARRARPDRAEPPAEAPTPPAAVVEPAPPPPDIKLNKSKTIEINADLDVDVDVDIDVDIININTEKPESREDAEPQNPPKPPRPPRRRIPKPEVIPLVAAEEKPEPLPEPEAVVFPEEAIIEELCANEADIDALKDETDNPFEHFAGCECKQEHHPRCNSARQQRPPNFNNFINEHNRNIAGNSREGKDSCCGKNSSGRGFSTGGGTMPGQGNAPGGFSWKDFKKN